MSDETDGVDVLVVGAGPTGLSAAIDLMRHGLRVRVIDLLEEPPPWSKAQIMHARTLEILEGFGVAEAALDAGKKMHAFNVYAMPEMKRAAHLPIAGIDSELGYFLSIPQRETERLLSERLVQMGGRVERQVTLESFTQSDEGVVATLAHGGGRRETAQARWILGCDGAHSAVRGGLGLALEGSTYEMRIIQADLHVAMPLQVDDDEVVAFLGPEGIFGLFPLPGERRYRMLVPVFEGPDLEATLPTFEAIAARCGPAGMKVSDPRWMVSFKVHCRMVKKYRVGRAFLAGDAAHIHSPAGGQGMNTGIQDAHNLAWKIAMVHKGLYRPALLDSYERERLPVAAETLASTDAVTRRGQSIMSLRNPLAVEARNRLMAFVTSLGFVTSRVAQGVSMLNIGYPDSPVCAQHRRSLGQVNVLAVEGSEAPALRDWVDFGNGPAPGFRAPDARVEPSREGSPRLFDRMQGAAHTLLLFDGATASAEGYQNLQRVAEMASARLEGALRVVMIVPRAERPSALTWEGDVLLDPDGEVHRRYGARSECLYLVRPDGHVAFRAQPADEGALRAYLDTILVV